MNFKTTETRAILDIRRQVEFVEVPALFARFYCITIQLLDEVEYDILCYQDRCLIIQDVMRKPNSIIVLLYSYKCMTLSGSLQSKPRKARFSACK